MLASPKLPLLHYSHLLALSLLIPCVRAESSLSVSLDVLSHQRHSGIYSSIGASVDGEYDTRFGALITHSGEADWALPAPGGWVAVGIAYEPIWVLGGQGNKTLKLARYGLDLPNKGSLSFGIANPVASNSTQHLIVANMDLPLGKWRDNSIEFIAWGSMANADRSNAMGLSQDSHGFHLEQTNAIIQLNHPINKQWSWQLGAGSRWEAQKTNQHLSGWQIITGITWDIYK